MKLVGLPKKTLTGLLLATALSSGNSYASKVLLDFEGTAELVPILNFYNGQSGIDYGVQFTQDAITLIDSDATSDKVYSGNFTNAPSGITALSFNTGDIATMNVTFGFSKELSLFYSFNPEGGKKTTVKIYDGMNGTGKELAKLDLASNYRANECFKDLDSYCHWDQVSTSFSGIAHSVVFDGPRLFTLYDNISFNTAPPSEVPVPAAFWLMGSAMLGLLRIRRKY